MNYFHLLFLVPHVVLFSFTTITGASLFGISRGRPSPSSVAAFQSRYPAKQSSLSILRGGSSDNDNTISNWGPVLEYPEEWAPGRPKQCLVLMDCFCPYFGLFMASRAKEIYGVATVMVLSEYMKGYFSKQQPDEWRHWLPMAIPADINAWRERLLPCEEIVAVHCESDSGLADAERLALSLGAQCHNGPPNEARRDKFLMNQVAAAYGLPVVKQKLCHTLTEALDFANELLKSSSIAGREEHKNINTQLDTGLLGRGNNIPEQKKKARCIVKPTRGVASENIHLCEDPDSVRQAYEIIKGSTVFGAASERHQAVLVQEFAAGTEYAVDVISKNGEHKVAALWRYDKRAANGAPFCYYATELVDATRSAVGSMVCDYAKECLTAVGIKWGISHNEIIVTPDGPRLVEVNCRQHNMDFAPITMACIGYNAFDMLLAAYLGGQPVHAYPPSGESQRLDWDSLPDVPSLRAHGAMVHLVNSVNGTLTEVKVQHLNEIQNMESVLEIEVYPDFLDVGGTIFPTVDIRSDAGWVQLINDDPSVFQRDYNRIVELMPHLFQTSRRASTQLQQEVQNADTI